MPLLWVLASAAFVSAFTIQMINPLVPAIARDFGLTVETAALIASAYTFPYAFAQPILGPVADAVGKARVIKVCLGVLLLALLIGSVATSFEMLFVARVIAGFAGGGIIPVAFAIIGDRIALEDRQVALSRLVMASQISILLGSTLGGVIAAHYGWRLMFIAPAVLAVLALVLMLVFLPPRPGAPRHPVSIARMRAGYGEALSGPLAAVCLVGVFIEGVAMNGLQPFIAGRLEARGMGSLAEAGLVLAAYSLGAILFTLMVRRLLARFGRAHLVRIGGVIACLALSGAAWAVNWQQQAAAFLFLGVGFFMIHNSLQAIGTELAPTARGSGVALFAFVFFLGQAAGPPLYRLAFAALGDTVPILIGALVLVLAAAWIARGIEMAEPAVPVRD
jgi:predicted MFS family arabinose efflux permease